jgi:cell division protein FtsB
MRFRFALKAALCLLALLGALYVFAYPVRTYLAQERQVAQVERTISVLGAQDAKLNSQYKLLQRTSYVDQLARADYGYVKPGQQAYEVLPPSKHGGPGQSGTAQPGSQGAREATAHKSRSSSPWYGPLEFWHHL